MSCVTFLFGNMTGLYTEDTWSVEVDWSVSKKAGSDEFHYRLFIGRNERFE